MKPPLLGCGALLAAAAFVAVAASPASARPRTTVFEMDAPQIRESSSLVVSTTHPHLAYTMNDSGDTNHVYVIDTRTGDLVGTTTLTGVKPVDTEAMAGGTDGQLVIADIGDNDAVRTHVAIYRIPEPDAGTASVHPEVVTLTYEHGARDAEGALYDADTGTVFVVSKEYASPHVYRTPSDVFDRSRAVLKPIAEGPYIATDATFLPGQQVAVIRTYIEADFYRFPGFTKLRTERLPLQPQGESVAAPPGGAEIWIGSEGEDSKVLSVEVPDLTPTEPTTSPTTGPTSTTPTTAGQTSSDDQNRKAAAWSIAVVAGVLLAVVLVVGTIRYIRHHPD